MPACAFTFICTDSQGKQHIINKLTSKDHKWMSCSPKIADLSRSTMKFPQNFHGLTPGINTSLNLSKPSVNDVKNQAFSVTYEGSKHYISTGACGLLKSIPSIDVKTYEKGIWTALNSINLTDNP